MVELIIGSGISILVQYLKEKRNMNKQEIMIILFILSVFSGIAYHGLERYNMLEDVLQILTGAGAFYAFVIRNMKK